MEYRTFGRTGWQVSAIGFGAWGIGGDAWGPTDDKTSLAEFALRWILMFPEVSSTIAGAKNPQQIKDNIQAISLPPLSDETMQRVREVYDKYLRAQVHHRW